MTDEQPDVLPALPDGCLETGRVIIRSYLDGEGKAQYTIHHRGEETKFSLVGALAVAQFDILQAGWGDDG